MSRFSEELHIIPRAAWIIAVAVSLGILICFSFLLQDQPDVPLWAQGFLPFIPAMLLGIYVLVIGYINADARLRRMNSLVWTLVAIFVPNAIGVVLYFVLRDPIPVHCTRCGRPVDAKHAFCPHCGATLKPACRKCSRAVEPGWSNCPYCGASLA
jgi:RNA polymerase subunit RPABC4/transcription elongation factor Spt4